LISVAQRDWRSTLETVCIPVAAIAVALLLFGMLCALAGANPFGVYASIYKAAFGSWSAVGAGGDHCSA
jgi:simple sugar transport system permease protein